MLTRHILLVAVSRPDRPRGLCRASEPRREDRALGADLHRYKLRPITSQNPSICHCFWVYCMTYVLGGAGKITPSLLDRRLTGCKIVRPKKNQLWRHEFTVANEEEGDALSDALNVNCAAIAQVPAACRVLLSACCLLPAACCLLLAACCVLRVAYCLLLAAYCLLLAACCFPRVSLASCCR